MYWSRQEAFVILVATTHKLFAARTSCAILIWILNSSYGVMKSPGAGRRENSAHSTSVTADTRQVLTYQTARRA